MNRCISIALLCFASIGCEKIQSTIVTPNSPSPDPKINEAGNESDSESSPTQSPISVNATPAEVVARFLNAIRNGKDETVSMLLTQKARIEAEKNDFQVSTTDHPNAKYRVGAVEFVSDADQGAHVTSHWTYTDEDGSIQSFDVIWILTRWPAGWRVKGLRTPVFADGPPVFLDFENFDDMQQKLQQADSQLSSPNPSQTATQLDRPNQRLR